ncbi:MAG: hypothetical protein M1816_002254 [Peltula sp. TS41687]|nr:MAG: hypothetical protein M1816_002254 [Peltula sp. TS41687]
MEYPPQNSAPYVYAASGWPPIYSNEHDLTYFLAPEPEAEAYPPTSYLMDPQKHELYMNPTRQQTFNPPSLVRSQLETISSSATEPGNDELDRHMSPPPEQTSSSKSSEETECLKKNADDSNKDGAPSGQSKKIKEETASEGNEPYAQLIYRALKDAPGNKMVLKDIYHWFSTNTEKSKNPSQKGWQNSIRHNLSMNGKVEQDPASGDSKKGFVWVLEPSAITEGVKSTTRYRKPGAIKKAGRSDGPVLQRQVSGRKGGQASKRAKCGRSKRAEKCASPAVVAQLSTIVESTDNSPSQYYGNEAISEQDDQLSELAARHPGRPLISADLEDFTRTAFQATPCSVTVRS